jgi:hypothetical protein
MSALWVACVYKPHQGQESELRSLFRRHFVTLREQGLVADRPHLLLRSRADGSFLELFAWKSEEASGQAHQNKFVMEIWDGLGKYADMLTLADLSEAKESFPHFEEVTDLIHDAPAG